MVVLLTINSFPFPFPHQISRGLGYTSIPDLIFSFFFFSETLELIPGNYSAIPISHRDFHRHDE